MRCRYALAGLPILLAACGTDDTGSLTPVAPHISGPRGYNEVSSGSGWIRGDRDDYAPGDTVMVLGGGWEPGEIVLMTLTEEPDVQEDLVLTSVADAEGNFANADFGVTDIHIGVVFTLRAEGQTSGMTASTMFNDGVIQDATIEMRNPACTSAQGSVISGSTICAHASFSINGTGGTDAQFRWKNPSGVIVEISQATAFGNLGSGLHTDLSRSATLAPVDVGTWTVYLCQSTDTNTAPGGQARCPGATGTNPLGASHRATQTFTVSQAPPSDTQAPTLNCTVPDQALWYGADVTVSCTASDAGSGLADPSDASFSLSTSVVAGSETANAQTGSRNVCDNDGNCTTAGPYTFMVDRKAPTVSCGSPDGVWHSTDVSIGCTAADGGSGLAIAGDAAFSLVTSVPAGTETANASTDSRNVCDDVGNCATAGPIAGNMVDKKGPVVTLVCPAAPVIIGASANASWTSVDGGSGVASGFASGNIALDTSSVGEKTATAPAGTSKDNVENLSGQQTCAYSVAYDFYGFFTPVDNPTVMNVAKAGQSIPLKWRLLDASGNAILNLSNVKVTVVTLSCNIGVTGDMLEEYAAGASGLQNLGDGNYQFNWKTPSTYSKSCKTLKLDLGEASPHTALFQFTR